MTSADSTATDDIAGDHPSTDEGPARIAVDVAFASEASAPGTCGVASPGTPACPGMCGNGRVDSCPECRMCGPASGPDGGICCTHPMEACDGTPAQTCVALGYRGGATACTARCLQDTSGCERCSTDTHVARCLAPAAGQIVAPSFGLAAAGDRVALAWASIDPAHRGTDSLQLVVLDGDLSVIARAPCLAFPAIWSVSVMANATGWLVAFQLGTDPGTDFAVYLQRYDADANPIGGPAYVGPGAKPRLTAGDGEVALLEYEVAGEALLTYPQGAVAALLIHPDGRAASAPQVVFDGRTSAFTGSVVWLDDGFLLAWAEVHGPNDFTSIVRIERDGTVRPRTQPVGMQTYPAQLLFDGASIALVYSNVGSTSAMNVQPLDRSGNAAGPRVDLLAPGLNTGPIYSAFHNHQYFLVQYGMDGQLHGGIFDLAFRASGATWSVGRTGIAGIGMGLIPDAVHTASLGSRLIVAWTDGGYEDLALAVAALQP